MTFEANNKNNENLKECFGKLGMLMVMLNVNEFLRVNQIFTET